MEGIIALPPPPDPPYDIATTEPLDVPPEWGKIDEAEMIAMTARVTLEGVQENVVAAAGTQYRMSQGEMERMIRETGYEPRQRRTLYEPL